MVDKLNELIFGNASLHIIGVKEYDSITEI
jgi:hypothetical protein